jgi:hypothetical protein
MQSNQNAFIIYCINGLSKMYLPETGTFSASYREINGSMHNVRDPRLEYKYSMNTFMGLHKSRLAGYDVPFDIESDYVRLAKNLAAPYITPEEIAATVWAGGALNIEIPGQALSALKAVLNNQPLLQSATAQTLAWLIFACIEAGNDFLQHADFLVKKTSQEYFDTSSCLVRHTPKGYRSNWSSFAASCYIAYAFLVYGRICSDLKIRNYGLQIVEKLVQLQGSQGQWAWYYHVPTGVVSDYYQVYSVHQEAMAPFFLLEAIDQGHDEFLEPLMKGFRWILGENEIGQKMVASEKSVIWRSLKRKDYMERGARFLRGLGSEFLQYKSIPLGTDKLLVNYECRSYELGWALWAFAGRHDFNGLLNNQAFK